jgi:hypothetical protein
MYPVLSGRTKYLWLKALWDEDVWWLDIPMDNWTTVVITMEVIQSMSNSDGHAESLSPTEFVFAFFFTCTVIISYLLHGNNTGRKR